MKLLLHFPFVLKYMNKYMNFELLGHPENSWYGVTNKIWLVKSPRSKVKVGLAEWREHPIVMLLVWGSNPAPSEKKTLLYPEP